MPIVTDFGVQPAWTDDGTGIYHFSIRDGVLCAWLQPLDPATKRPVGAPRELHHLHQPRLRAGADAPSTNHVAPGYFYLTLTEAGSNIWMLRR